MWLTIQIAAGIVLAYVVIRNGSAVWRYSLGLMVLTAMIAAVIVVGSFANDAAEQFGGLSGIAAKAARFVGLIMVAGIYVMGMFGEGYAVKVIFNRVFHRQWIPSETMLFMLGVGNFMFSGLAIQGFDLTNEGPILGPIDDYSRAHGWADGLTVAAWFTFSLWIVPLAIWLDRRQTSAAQMDEIE